MQFSQHDTICAIATPPGHGGLGVIRVSGPKAFAVHALLWQGCPATSDCESRKLYLGNVGLAGHPPIDRVMIAKFPAPHTYTGDDVVEFSCHGSPVVLKRLLAACCVAGARLAMPGEFTRRAYVSGKLDLAQAEAVADLIAATSETAARHAQDQLAGKLSCEVERLHEQLVGLRTFVEAAIDFPEEDIEMIEHEGIGKQLATIRASMERLIATSARGRLIRDGVRVVLVGRPNVGKSSLLNRLAGSPCAIVHHEPGTTRDVVEVQITIDGIVFHMSDTAGLREGVHPVEQMGIERTRTAMERADLLLIVFDGSMPLTDEDRQLLAETASRPSIICINKTDLGLQQVATRGQTTVRVSALTGEGIDALYAAIAAYVKPTGISEHEGPVVTNLRHKEALVQSEEALREAALAIDGRLSAEFVAHHLRLAQDALGRITGMVTTDDILDNIFTNFCIGK